MGLDFIPSLFSPAVALYKVVTYGYTDDPASTQHINVSKKERVEGQSEASEAEIAADREKLQVSIEEQAKVRRVQQQCILFGVIDELSKFYLEMKDVGECGFGKMKKWSNLSTVEGDPSLLFNKLTMTDAMKQFINITPDQLSSLIPMIRIFKHVYPDPAKKDSIPVEFKFGKFMKLPTSADILTSQAIRGDSAGIKNISFTNEGQSKPVAKTLTADITFLFDSAETFLAQRSGPNNLEYSYGDLIVPPSKLKWDSFHSGKFYRIRAEIGWVVPEALDDFSEDLKEAIYTTKLILGLELMKHELSFKENGMLELKASYSGWIEGSFRGARSDIFNLQKTQREFDIESRLEQRKREEQASRARQHDKTTNSEPGGGKSPAIPSEDSDTLGHKLHKDSLQLSLLRIRQVERGRKYQALLDAMISRNSVFFVEVPESELGTLTIGGFGGKGASQESTEDITAQRRAAQWSEGTRAHWERRKKSKNKAESEEAIKAIAKHEKAMLRTQGTQGVKAYRFGQMKFASATGGTTKENATAEKLGGVIEASTAGKGTAVASAASYNKEVNKHHLTENATQVANRRDASNAATLKIDSETLNRPSQAGFTKFYYMFLGDILDAVFDTMQERTSNRCDDSDSEWVADAGNLGVLVGPFRYLDPITAEYKTINITEIPISMDLFNVWYIKNVIEPLRESYSLDDFLRDIIKDLVVPAMGKQCYEGGAEQVFPVTIGISELIIPDYNDAQLKFKSGRRYCADTITFKPKAYRRRDNQQKSILYIYGHTMAPTFLRGDKSEDFDNGIYHFNIGSPNGLLRSVDFKRTDQPMLRSHRVVSYRGSDTEIFREIYDADVSMFGNPLFLPGQYVFINPSPFGNPSMAGSTAFKLGLGGYYFVVKVKHDLSPGDYKTTLDCIWQDFGILTPGMSELNIPSRGCRQTEGATAATAGKKRQEEFENMTPSERQSAGREAEMTAIFLRSNPTQAGRFNRGI